MIHLVINADDFGYSRGINKGIIYAHEKGVVTSTSVMVFRPFAREAKHLLEYPKLSVGLHFDITDEGIKGDYLKYKRIYTSSVKNIKKEFDEQIDEFTKIMGKLPDHVDGHHHVHAHSKIKPIIKEFSKKHNVPVRAYKKVNFVNDFFGWNKLRIKDWKRIKVDSLIKILSNLKEGVNEIMCHAGFVDDDLKKISKYLKEREIEIQTLTDKKVIDYIDNSKIKLCSWKYIADNKLF